MSEKRFTLTCFNKEKKIWRITDKKGLSIITLGGVEDRLNELNDENEQLRQQVKDWKFINDFQEKEIDALKEALKEKEYVEEENEQLKKELNNLKKDETLLYHYYTLARYGGDGV